MGRHSIVSHFFVLFYNSVAWIYLFLFPDHYSPITLTANRKKKKKGQRVSLDKSKSYSFMCQAEKMQFDSSKKFLAIYYEDRYPHLVTDVTRVPGTLKKA